MFNQETKDIINTLGKILILYFGVNNCTSKEYQRVSEVFGIDAALLEAGIFLLKKPLKVTQTILRIVFHSGLNG